MNKIYNYQEEWTSLKQKQKSLINKYNTSISCKNKSKYYKQIMKIEEKLNLLRNSK